MNKPNETLEHYETMARAALYPELVECIHSAITLIRKWHELGTPDIEINRWEIYWEKSPEMKPIRELLSRLPERDKEST